MKSVTVVCAILAAILLPISKAHAEPDATADVAGISNEIETPVPENQVTAGENKMSMRYFGILYGPSVESPNSYQPSAKSGEPDADIPVSVRNYTTLGYNLSESVVLSATATWDWKPMGGQELSMRDPYARLGHSSLISSENFNLYGDLRVHFPVTPTSRENDLLAGLQTFQAATYEMGTRLTLGLNGSVRYNYFGSEGWGDEIELYLAPNLTYQLSNSLAFNVLYEMGASHPYGGASGEFNNDGTDLEPGVIWDITNNLTWNPYLNLYPGNRLNFRSTSIGMTLSWRMI